MESLASNPSSSIANQPGPQQDPLGIVNQLKDREMRDFQTKANFMSQLSLKQDRLKQLFDPNNPDQDILGTRNITPEAQGTPPIRQSVGLTPGMSQRDPNAMTAHETADIGIKQQGLGLEQQKMAQAGKLGEQALGVKTKQEELNAKKEQDIHDQKQNELKAKIDESGQKLTQAQAKLEAAQGNAEASLAAHKEMNVAMEERHKLELAQKESQFQRLSAQHNQVIKDLEQKNKDAKNKKVTTEVNPEGTKRTTTTSSGDTVQVKHKNGKMYEIPADKLDEWNASHAPDQQEPEQ
jgi:hypothetical protein